MRRRSARPSRRPISRARDVRAAVVAERVEPRRLFSTTAGVLDPSLNENGVQPFSGDAGPYTGVVVDAIAIAPNGDMVVAGSALDTGATVDSMVVGELLPNGVVDDSFGTDGFTVFNSVYQDGESGAKAIALLPNGNIVIGGTDLDYLDSTTSGELVEFSATGQLVTHLTLGDGDSDGSINALAVQSNGMVVAVGSSSPDLDPNGDTPVPYAIAYRVNPTSLTLDSSFGSGGSRALNTGGSGSTLNGVAVQANGGIVVVGANAGDAYVARLTSSGAVDGTFSASASLAKPGTAAAVAVQPGGQVVIAGTSGPAGLFAERLNANGAADTSFNGNGYRAIGGATASAIALQSDGKIVLGGYNGDLVAARLNANGTPDATFGAANGTTNGVVDVTTIGGDTINFNNPSAMALDGDGRITLAGGGVDESTGTVDAAVARLLPGEYAVAGTPTALTGTTTVQAVNYDDGGPNVAYYDYDDSNDSVREGTTYFSPYRPGSAVDIELGTGGASAAPHVAYTEPGEFLQYTVSAAVAGTYTVAALVGDSAPGSTFHLTVDGGTAGPEIAVPNTGSFLTFKSTPAGSVYLSAGTHVINVTFDTVDAVGNVCGNYQSFTFTAPATPSGSIAGTAFKDANANGKLDSGEAGLAGVTVYLDLNHNGKYDSGDVNYVTGSAGTYSFNYLPAGTFYVGQVLPSGYTQTLPTTAQYTTTLVAAQHVTGENFGDATATAAPTGVISGTVFKDANGNGKLDSGEAGLAGVTVYLDLNHNGKYDSGDVNYVTGSAGTYSFNYLPAGTFYVGQVLPSGYTQTVPTTAQYTTTLVAAQHVTGENFGDATATAAPTGVISGTVFKDANGNGKLDSGEAGLSGVTVYLDLNHDGKFDSGDVSYTTGSGGAYAFNYMPAGTFYVGQVVPSGDKQTLPTTAQYTIALAAAQHATGENFGDAAATVAPTGSISGYAYKDANKDGKYGTGDSVLANVTVFLDLNHNGKFDGGDVSYKTGSNGYYAFNYLPAGTFYVGEVIPSGYTKLTSPASGEFTLPLTNGQVIANVDFGNA